MKSTIEQAGSTIYIELISQPPLYTWLKLWLRLLRNTKNTAWSNASQTTTTSSEGVGAFCGS